MFWALIAVPRPTPVLNVMLTTFVVRNVILIGHIQVIAPNALPDCLFINPFCAHVVFEGSTNRL